MNRKTLALSALSMLLFLPIAASSQNLLTNGDFEQGNTGFTTDYTYIPGNGTLHTENGEYSVISNPATAFTNGYASYGDHTTGSGLMLFADSSGPGHNIWAESLDLSAGEYTFTGWIANADPTVLNPATLSLFVNGVETGDTFTISQNGGIWEEWTVHLNLNSGGMDTLSIQDLNEGYHGAGDDFTLDDLSLTRGTTPEPGSFLLMGSGVLTCIGVVRRKHPTVRH